MEWTVSAAAFNMDALKQSLGKKRNLLMISLIVKLWSADMQLRYV